VKLSARGIAVAVIGLAAVLGLSAAATPAAGAPAGTAAASASPAGDSAPGSTGLVKQDIGGSALASPGIAVNYPASGAIPLPDVPASAYVIADAKTGQVLAAKDAHGLYPPASTLKMLTAITLIPRLNPNATVLVSPEAADAEEYDVGLVAGQRYKVSDLFNALLLISANDAAVALTQATGSLAKGMGLINAEAHHLQAYDVVAKQPNGLPANGQVTSAYDQALIARQALSSPAFMKYDSTLKATFPVTPRTSVPLVNQNYLLTQYPGGIGGKIGWTEAAEATYIGMARRHGVTLIVTVLHCTSLQEITSGEQLLNWGFAMDGKVRPVGDLVRPLPALATASHGKPAGPQAGSVQANSAEQAAAPAVGEPAAGKPGPTLPAARPASDSPAPPPVIPLTVGAGVIIVIVLTAAWLTRRRRRSVPLDRHAADLDRSPPAD
jgi:serine-type D-Ala-D-Ala carboxypeptidase (penicillin-binding protein 5/6)